MLVWLVGGCWRGVVAGAGRGHKVGSVWEQEQQQQQQQSKQGGHVRENKKDERTYLHGKFCALKGQGDKRAQRSEHRPSITAGPDESATG